MARSGNAMEVSFRLLIVIVGGLTVAAMSAVILGNIQHKVEADGVVVPIRQVTLSASIDGFLNDVWVSTGEYVHVSQPLYKIRADELLQNLKSSQANLTRTCAKLRAVSQDRQSEWQNLFETKKTRLMLEMEQSRTRLHDLEVKEARLAYLMEHGLLSQEELDACRSSLEIARAEFSRDEKNIEILIREELIREGDVGDELIGLRADSGRLASEIRLLENMLHDTIAYAPFPGLADVDQIMCKRGAHFERGSSMLQLVSLDTMFFEAYVTEQNIRHITAGQTAIIELSAVPLTDTRPIEGRVCGIGPERAVAQEGIYYRVRISIDIKNSRQNAMLSGDSLLILPGMTGRAHIIVNSKSRITDLLGDIL
jgi:multidrug resistance efflux pump